MSCGVLSDTRGEKLAGLVWKLQLRLQLPPPHWAALWAGGHSNLSCGEPSARPVRRSCGDYKTHVVQTVTQSVRDSLVFNK